jgi:hypothetical protein
MFVKGTIKVLYYSIRYFIEHPPRDFKVFVQRARLACERSNFGADFDTSIEIVRGASYDKKHAYEIRKFLSHFKSELPFLREHRLAPLLGAHHTSESFICE